MTRIKCLIYQVIILVSINSSLLAPTTTTTESDDTTTPTEANFENNSITFYAESFKTMMSESINIHYNLTSSEMEKINMFLDEFLINFAHDLSEILNKNSKSSQTQKETPEGTFEDINKRIMEEFPQIKEETANEIVYRLKNDLIITRNKIDSFLNQHKNAT